MVQTIFNDPAYRPYFIGYQDMIKRVKDATEQFNQQSYPPFNVKKVDYNKYVIEIAVAGFDKTDRIAPTNCIKHWNIMHRDQAKSRRDADGLQKFSDQIADNIVIRHNRPSPLNDHF